jgi:hypothetical protein
MSFATTQFLGNFYHFNNILHLSSFLILCFGKRKGKGGKQKYSYQIAHELYGTLWTTIIFPRFYI